MSIRVSSSKKSFDEQRFERSVKAAQQRMEKDRSSAEDHLLDKDRLVKLLERAEQEAKRQEARYLVEKEQRELVAEAERHQYAVKRRDAVKRAMSGHRPAVILHDEARDFPEHKHVWTIVEISNEPVGVTCKICDQNREIAAIVAAPVPSWTPEIAVLSMEIGSHHRLDNGQVGNGQVVELESVHVNHRYGERAEYQMTFVAVESQFDPSRIWGRNTEPS